MLEPYGFFDLLLRIGCTLIASTAIGLERESHGRAAGLRTVMIVGVAACIAMILSERFYVESVLITHGAAIPRPDPARLAAGILSGIGFIGAGSIIRNGNRVQGVTTAATLWMTTILGLTFGDGQYLLGVMGLAVMLVALFIVPRFENRVKNDFYAILTIKLHIDSVSDNELKSKIEAEGVRIKRVEINYDLQRAQKTLACELKFKKSGLFALSQRVIQATLTCPGVIQVDWKA